jgi:digeranylgeranylglycerophospholipid reductase
VVDYDVIVVGAGTAGTTAAYTLGKKGHSILLIDRKSREKIGDKTCGDAVASHHLAELNDLIGLPDPPKNVIEHLVKGIDLVAPDKVNRIRMSGPSAIGLSFNRLALGQWLLSLVEATDVEILSSTRALHLLYDDGKVSGVRIRKADSDTQQDVKSRIVIDASGASGLLRRQLRPSSPIDREVAAEDVFVATRCIYETPEYTFENPDVLEIHWNQDETPGGYTWVFPQGPHRVNVGTGLLTLPGHKNPKMIFDSFVRPNWDFMKTNLVLIDEGGGIAPMRRPIDTMVDDNFMLVGDAACQVNPVHGGGIGPSMQGGAFTGITASEALESGDTSIDSLWPYNVRYMKSYGVKQAGLDIFRWHLLTITNDDIIFAFRKGIIQGSDLLSVSVSGEIKSSFIGKMKRLLSGVGNIPFLRGLSKVSKLMSEIRQLYNEYPESPDELSRWKTRLVPIYSQVKDTTGI